MPIFSSTRSTLNPANAVSIMKAVMPLRPDSLSVWAKTIMKSAMSPLVMNCLRPFNVHEPSSAFTAIVERLKASEPALGSVRAKAPIMSPSIPALRYLPFCSAVPNK